MFAAAAMVPPVVSALAVHAPTFAAPRASGAPSAPAQELPPGIAFKINGQNVTHDRFVKELDDYLGESFRDTFVSHVLIEQGQALM